MQRFSRQTCTICATGGNVEYQSNKLPVGGGGGGRGMVKGSYGNLR